MRRTLRGHARGAAALLLTAAVMAPVAAHAAPNAGTPAGSPDAPAAAHVTLDDALRSVGSDRGDFASQSALADRLTAASADLAARFPAAFAGVRITDGVGEVGVVRGVDDDELLAAEADRLGFRTYDAPAAAGALEEKADRVEAWRDALPPAQREAVTATGVDPATGAVTVLVDESAAVPAPPADLGAEVRRGSFRKAQSGGGSSGGAGSPIGPSTSPSSPTPTPPPATTTPAPITSGAPLYGGSRIRTTDPATRNAAWCSLGFNGMRDGRVVNITAAHCSRFPVEGPFVPGVISETFDGDVLGRYTAAEADVDLDAALVTIDPEDADRFRNSHVLTGAAPLRLDGHRSAVVGQTVCKYGQKSGYTCGHVESVDAAYVTAGKTVLFDLCTLPGDSGGVIFSGTRALAVTSESNAWKYTSCAEAAAQMPLQTEPDVPMTIGIAAGAFVERFPGLVFGAA